MLHSLRRETQWTWEMVSAGQVKKIKEEIYRKLPTRNFLYEL